MARLSRLGLAVVIVSLTLVGCGHGTPTRDQAPPSLVLREVFFTNTVTPTNRSYRTVDELGPRLRRFDPDRDEKLVLIAVFDQKSTVNVTAALIRPDGQQYGSFEQRLEGRPTGGWQTVRRWWSLHQLRAYPGEWHIRLWVDNQPMGQYYFVLEPPR